MAQTPPKVQRSEYVIHGNFTIYLSVYSTDWLSKPHALSALGSPSHILSLHSHSGYLRAQISSSLRCSRRCSSPYRTFRWYATTTSPAQARSFHRHAHPFLLAGAQFRRRLFGSWPGPCHCPFLQALPGCSVARKCTPGRLQRGGALIKSKGFAMRG